VPLFAIFPMIGGANSHLGLRTYFKVQRDKPSKSLGIHRQRLSAHMAIRYSLHRLGAVDLERVFREHASSVTCAHETNPPDVFITIR
jgi:hypothetical protein